MRCQSKYLKFLKRKREQADQTVGPAEAKRPRPAPPPSELGARLALGTVVTVGESTAEVDEAEPKWGQHAELFKAIGISSVPSPARTHNCNSFGWFP